MIVSFSEIIDTANVSKNANIQKSGLTVSNTPEKLSTCNSSKTNPPTIIGILSKKLYSAAWFSSFPARISEDIVELKLRKEQDTKDCKIEDIVEEVKNIINEN